MLLQKTVINLLVLTLLIPALSYGQKSTQDGQNAKNEIHLFAARQYYFNKLDVNNDGIAPDPISAKNTLGYHFGIGYQHITHYGLVYGAGISFEQLSQDVNYNFPNANFFYPKNDYPYLSQQLSMFKQDYSYFYQLRYLSFVPKIGYRFKFPFSIMKGWYIQTSLSLAFQFCLNNKQLGDFDIMTVGYPNKAQDSFFITSLYREGFESGSKFFNWRGTWHFYLGLSKKVNWRIMKNLNIGIEVTHTARSNGATGSGNVDAFDYEGYVISHDEYKSRDFSVGLKLGIGFWPGKENKIRPNRTSEAAHKKPFWAKTPQANKTTKGRNEIEFSITPQYYLNKLNVHNDGVLPGLISARNSMGINIGLDYYRITHYGLIYGAGISYGNIPQIISKNFKNLSFFYPEEDNKRFSKYLAHWYFSTLDGSNMQYVSFRPSLGYWFKPQGRLLKDWRLQMIASCDFLMYTSGIAHNASLYSEYTNKAGDTIFKNKPIYSVNEQFGSPSYRHKKVYLLYGLSFGLSRPVNLSIIHSINVGIKLTLSGTNYKNNNSETSGFSEVNAYNYKGGAPISHNEYRARDFSIGLKFGVGLWSNREK